MSGELEWWTAGPQMYVRQYIEEEDGEYAIRVTEVENYVPLPVLEDERRQIGVLSPLHSYRHS